METSKSCGYEASQLYRHTPLFEVGKRRKGDSLVGVDCSGE
jgi:hypothetical protein